MVTGYAAAGLSGCGGIEAGVIERTTLPDLELGNPSPRRGNTDCRAGRPGRTSGVAMARRRPGCSRPPRRRTVVLAGRLGPLPPPRHVRGRHHPRSPRRLSPSAGHLKACPMLLSLRTPDLTRGGRPSAGKVTAWPWVRGVALRYGCASPVGI